MNKKLLALAIAAALAPAAAMADSGNVTIYGVMDASFDQVDNGSGSAVGAVSGTRTNKVSSNSSRLGFKGAEDMGNGTSAIWQVESQINVDGGNTSTTSANGGTTIGGRNTFVGLSSKTMGTAVLGRHDTPYKIATRDLDFFADGLADNRNLMGQGASYALSNQAFNFDGRQSDVLAYISPTVNGFMGAIAYVAGAEAATTSSQSKGNAWSMMGMYNNGPLMASLAYEKHNIGGVNTGDISALAGNTDNSEKSWKLGAGYTIDQLKLGFEYERITDNLNAGAELVAHNAWNLGGAYTMGANVIKLAYTRAGQRASVSDTGAHQVALGLDHNLSKRTKVYIQYVKLDNDNSAAYNLNGAGSTGAPASAAAGTAPGTGAAAVAVGADPSAISIGMRHTF